MATSHTMELNQIMFGFTSPSTPFLPRGWSGLNGNGLLLWKASSSFYSLEMAHEAQIFGCAVELVFSSTVGWSTGWCAVCTLERCCSNMTFDRIPQLLEMLERWWMPIALRYSMSPAWIHDRAVPQLCLDKVFIKGFIESLLWLLRPHALIDCNNRCKDTLKVYSNRV